MTKPLIPIDQIAGHLGVIDDSIYRYQQQRPGTHHPGRLWKFKVFEVDARLRTDDPDKASSSAASYEKDGQGVQA